MKPPAQFVSDFLEAVARRAHDTSPEFADHVRERLDHGEREYGDNGSSYQERPLAHILSEIREEMADVPAWAVLAAERSFDVEAAGKISPEVAQALRVELVAWAAETQVLWQRVSAFLAEHPTS